MISWQLNVSIKDHQQLAKYKTKKVEQEAKNKWVARRTNNSPYTKVHELVEELKAISHPNEEQEHLKDIFWSATRWMQYEKSHSGQPVGIGLYR